MNEDVQDAVDEMAAAQHAQAEIKKSIRVARLKALSRAADAFSRMMVELGPCYGATVVFSVPTDPPGQVETLMASGWFDENQGSQHLAQASDLLNSKHLELQEEIDKAALGRTDEKEGEVRSAEGGEAVPDGSAEPGADESGSGEAEGVGGGEPS